MNPLISQFLQNQAQPAPALGNTIAMPSAAPVMGGISAPITPAPQTSSNIALGTPLEQHQAKLNELTTQPYGADTIQSPLGRGIAKGLGITASIFAPGIARAFPGTDLGHQVRVAQQQALVANDEQQNQAAATLSDSQAQADQRKALATQEEAKAFALTHPKPGADVPDKPENLQQEHADAVIDAMHRGVDPAQDPKVQQLADAITSLQKTPATKDPNKDDKYIAINSKLAAGQPLSPDETAFKAGYEHYVKVNKLDPAGVRVQAMLQMPQAIADPNDPSREIFTTRKGAIGQEAPGSGDAAAARRMDTYMTSGKGGQTLNAFNTAQNHLQILGQAAEALHNGNSTLFNGAANTFAKVTGSPAPTNFDAVKNAVKGEVAKALTGNVTVSEQAELDKDFNNASSPAQISGIVQKYTQLMQGKKDALHQQYNDAKRGQPSFDGAGGTAAPAATHTFNPKTGKIEAIK